MRASSHPAPAPGGSGSGDVRVRAVSRGRTAGLGTLDTSLVINAWSVHLYVTSKKGRESETNVRRYMILCEQ